MSDYLGTFSLIRQAKPRNRWGPINLRLKRDASTACYDPNWVIKFYLPGQPQLVKSGPDKPDKIRFPICEKCLALGPEKGGVINDRTSCRCQAWPRRWAAEFLRTRTHLMLNGEMQRLESLRKPAAWTPLKEVLEVYEARGPADAKKRANYLRTIIEVPTGKTGDAQDWDDLTKGLCFEFAELWQEAGRREWHERGAMPADGWERLRAEAAKPLRDPTRKLQALDTKTVMRCNTSIRNYLNAARSIFGQKSRDTFLRGLIIPPLKEFMETKVTVMMPKGHQEFTREDYITILEELPVLRRENPRVWLVNQMLMRFALRPEEIFPARPGWLEEIQQGKKKRTRINIVNRPEEGFELKAGANAKPRHIWVPDDVLACMREVQNETSLIGGRHATEARNLVERDHPQWVREIGVDVDRPNYKFRHFALAERMTSEHASAAAALGGHSSSQTTERNYARTLGTLEPLSEEEVYRRLMEE